MKRSPDVEELCAHILRCADTNGLPRTVTALHFAKKAHDGQYRGGPENAPYITHPLSIACHAIALGIRDDELLAAILLHDVCEDCDIAPEELPAAQHTKDIVRALSRNYAASSSDYYRAISGIPDACIIKCLDRIDNMRDMAAAFTRTKMISYTREAEEKILPLIDIARNGREEYRDAVFEIECELSALVEIYRNLIAPET